MRPLTLLLLVVAVAFAQVKRPVEEFSTSAGALQVTPVRHASMMIEAGGQVMHVDPWSQGNYEGLPKADIILITHDHRDHLDPKLLPTLRKPETVIVAPEVVAKTVTGATVMRNGETKTLGAWSVEAIAMYNEKHERSPGVVFHPKGVGNGYVVTFGGLRIYVAGDTEGVAEMRALKNIDVAFLPMNLPFTMTPEEAADAAKAFKPKVVYPYHCRGTDLAIFEKALAGSGIEVRLLDWYY